MSLRDPRVPSTPEQTGCASVGALIQPVCFAPRRCLVAPVRVSVADQLEVFSRRAATPGTAAQTRYSLFLALHLTEPRGPHEADVSVRVRRYHQAAVGEAIGRRILVSAVITEVSACSGDARCRRSRKIVASISGIGMILEPGST